MKKCRYYMYRGSENSESYAGHLDRQAQISTGPEEN